MATVQQLANSIAQMEGFNTPGTIANRYNNPGNLRYATTQTGTADTVNGKFATFATAADGWQALYDYIQSKANSGTTLRDFIYTYAPPTENDTSSYLNYLSGQLGVSADESLGVLYAGNDSMGGATDSWDVGSYFSDTGNGLDTSGWVAVAGLVVVGLVVTDVF